jgi:ribonuclease VapC
LTVDLLTMAATSAVTLAEVQSKLVGRDLDPDEAWEAALSRIRDVMAFTAEHARITGDLAAQTGALGLSLGDRACLAFALALKAPVYTADKSWKKLKVSVRIHFIRG